MRRRVIFLIAILILTVTAGELQAAGKISRGGYIAITIDPILYESNLWETTHRISLDQFFTAKAADLGEALAEGLEKTAFRGRLRVLPGYHAEEQAEFRETGTPDTFLLTVDIRSRYGLTDSSSLAACVSGISCFLLSSAKMFTYESKTEATVTAFYFDPNGKRLRLVQDQFISSGKLSGDFYDAMDMSQELEWITQLTNSAIDDLRRQIIAKVPTELVRRSWRKAQDDLSLSAEESAARLQLPPKPQLGTRKQEEMGQNSLAGTKPEQQPSGELNLQQLVREVGPSVFKLTSDKGIASGFVISNRGFGVTALPMVEGAHNLKVKFHNGDELRARLVQSDPELQLALIAFEGRTPAALAFGSSQSGIKAVAFGYPLDYGLSISPTEITGVDARGRRRILQLSTSIPEGNSGGPLLDGHGKVIGILYQPPDDRQRTLKQAIAIEAGIEFFGHLADFRFE